MREKPECTFGVVRNSDQPTFFIDSNDVRRPRTLPCVASTLLAHPLLLAEAHRQLVRRPRRVPQGWPQIRRPPYARALALSGAWLTICPVVEENEPVERVRRCYILGSMLRCLMLFRTPGRPPLDYSRSVRPRVPLQGCVPTEHPAHEPSEGGVDQAQRGAYRSALSKASVIAACTTSLTCIRHSCRMSATSSLTSRMYRRS